MGPPDDTGRTRAHTEKPSEAGDNGVPRQPSRYAFADTAAAADRLAFLSDLFEEPSRSLLSDADPGPVGLAVDLGCGPGFTTGLLARVLRPKSLAGMDSSAPFIERAKTAGPPGVAWYRHDVTQLPFPTGPAHLLYSRWVLAHLSDPERVLLSWLSQLRPGGHLVAEEDEEIIASHPVLAAYDQMSSSLVAHHGGNLTIGPRLGHLPSPTGFSRTMNRLYRHRLPNPVTARLFGMNFAVWRTDPWIMQSYDRATLDGIAADLAALGASTDPGYVTFVHRQLAYRADDEPVPGAAA
jgi:trans-aconitate 2-methyltransferase